MNKKQMQKIVEQFKEYVGFAGWTVTIKTSKKDIENYATVDVELAEKTAKISLGQKFSALSDKRKRNVLIHELVHGRMAIFDEKVKILKDEEEEHLMNDITRGLEMLPDEENE